LVWRELLRLAHYVAATRDLGLTIRAVDPATRLEAWVDSFFANGEECSSWGGFGVGLPGSGLIEHSCSTPATKTDSTGAAELLQGLSAVKSITGLRVALRELRMLVESPTPLNTVAQVLVDGTSCRKVSRPSKWVCARYAMMRQAVENEVVELKNCNSDANPADIFTKPLTGAKFALLRAAVLGQVAPKVAACAHSTGPQLRLCSSCGAAQAALKRCAGCRRAYYCGAACQRQHWVLGGLKRVCGTF
jgi:hypothetical protein